MKLIILGKQGCGKGTQGKLIAKRYGIPHIVVGDIFRKLTKKPTKIGRELKSIINQGKFASNELVTKIVHQEVKGKKGFILDGFPRNLTQAEALDEIKDLDIDLVILLEISDKESIRRLSARRNCLKCGGLYNLITKKPKKQGICDKCKSKLTQREDDMEEAIKKRIELYKEKTQPIINIYKKKGILKEFNGELPPEKVFKQISEELNKLTTA